MKYHCYMAIDRGGPDTDNYVATAEGSLAIPEMDCPSLEGVMEQEKAYVDALIDAAAYRLTDDRLEVQNAIGETILVYVRQEEVIK